MSHPPPPVGGTPCRNSQSTVKCPLVPGSPLSYHLGADYFEDPDSTFVSQPRKYIDKLAETYKRLFNDEPPKGHKTTLGKSDHPELDTSEILEGDMAAKHLTMLGQL